AEKDNTSTPSAPPTYEEATSGGGMKSGVFPPPPSVPLHPSWAYVDPSEFCSCTNPPLAPDIGAMYGVMSYHHVLRFPEMRSLFLLFLSCSEPVKGYIQSNPAWYWASYGDLSWSCLCCSSCSYYNTTSVLLCLGITALVCFSVTIFSLQSKFDFTSCQGVLFVMMMVLLFSGILLAVILPFKYSLMVCLASFFPQFLAFDTQLLMGNRRYSLSPEEYVFGALNIYLDIIYIFSFFLQIFGSSRD
uniref:Protein lifeguard 2 n=1 Tax=Sphenodon punctatus TaxID=8508 RepID=A0A8D0GQ89_SPHPU